MRWTVTSRPEADDELTNIWLHAADQQEPTKAANMIDHDLARVPLPRGPTWEPTAPGRLAP